MANEKEPGTALFLPHLQCFQHSFCDIRRAILPAELKFDIYAYICGLNNMVAGVREKLASYGWHRKQIIFERYD